MDEAEERTEGDTAADAGGVDLDRATEEETHPAEGLGDDGAETAGTSSAPDDTDGGQKKRKKLPKAVLEASLIGPGESKTAKSHAHASPAAAARAPRATSSARGKGAAVDKDDDDDDDDENIAPAAPKNVPPKVPFDRLLAGAVCVLSGMVNPERADLRKALLAMGAEYRPDWTNDSTLLLTSYDNTPKARSVRASGGTVVLSDWVLACESERALLPFGRWLVHEGTNSWRSASASAAAAAGGSSDPSAAGRSRSGGDGGGGKGRAGGSAGAGGGGASASGKGGSGGGGGRGSGGASGSGASGRVRGPTAAEIAAKLLPDDLLQPIVVRDLAKFERALEAIRDMAANHTPESCLVSAFEHAADCYKEDGTLRTFFDKWDDNTQPYGIKLLALAAGQARTRLWPQIASPAGGGGQPLSGIPGFSSTRTLPKVDSYEIAPVLYALQQRYMSVVPRKA